jgi:signal peptidase I
MLTSTEIAAEPQTDQDLQECEEPGLRSQVISDVSKALAMTLVVFLIFTMFVVQGFKVYGSCMEPNLTTGERILGNKFVYMFERPARGDVIVFRYPLDPSRIYIKRVIGLPGETIEIRKGVVYVDDKPLKEDYVRRVPHGDYPKTWVRPDHLFVMGDFRDASNDSRYWGELPMENVEAKIWLRYWPMQKLGRVK